VKTMRIAAMALVTGFTLGGVTVGALRAQSKPPVFIVGEIDIIDPAGYKQFAAKSQASIKAAGGRFLVAGGTPVPLIGEPAKARIVIHQWDNMEQMRKWFDSPEQTQLREVQAKYARVRAFAVEGIAK
jgi:uncharacterized protein (DUF1330 family)